MYICSVWQVNCLARTYPNIDNIKEDLQQMSKTAFGEQAKVVPKHFSVFPDLRQTELRLMTTNAVVNQCPVQRQK